MQLQIVAQEPGHRDRFLLRALYPTSRRRLAGKPIVGGVCLLAGVLLVMKSG